MRTHSLRITLPVLGLFLAGVSFGSFAQPAEAGCINQCVGGYQTQSYSCVVASGTIYWPGGYFGGACNIGAGWYSAGWYSYACYDTCTQQVWNSCLSITRVCTPDTASISASPNPVPPNQTFSVTLSGGNYSPTYYNANYGGNIITNLPGGTYSGLTLSPGSYSLSVQACNANGCSGWVSGPTLVVQPPPPTSPWISAKPNPVSLNQVLNLSWGATGATSYNYSFNGSSSQSLGAQTSWSYTPGSVPLTVGSYTVAIQGCNAGGCSSWANTPFTVTPAVPIITSFTVNGVSVLGGSNSINLPATGGSVTAKYTSTGTTACSLIENGVVIASGLPANSPTAGYTGTLTAPTSYTLNCQ